MRLLYSILFALVIMSPLEAGGWGKTDQEVAFEGNSWHEVYFDMNGLHFTALIPNYSGAHMQNSSVSLTGDIEGRIPYMIATSFNPGPASPKTLEEFISVIAMANPGFTVAPLDTEDFKRMGCMYAADIIPKDHNEVAFLRFLCTKDRLIQMGTTDEDETHRTYFFNSISIH